MIKYLILLLTFLTVNKFLILNEESLVLLSFSIFVFLLITKIGSQIRSYLDDKINEVHKNLENSLDSVKTQISYVNKSWNYLHGSVYLVDKFKKYSQLQVNKVDQTLRLFLIYKLKSAIFYKISKFENLESEISMLIKLLLEIQLENILKQFLNVNNKVLSSFINHEKIMLV
uniref:ORF171 n=1 Tax=Cyanidioschyzon merolae (strain NIES-3377 / 10D) TaxID=280699 RepID=Q9ZZQ7_CYAM1|nr:ORF171 [Cyanidioschyzon merolae]BAA34658.1 ORF171 [Cyanidioschyzon merolae strain 10D]